MQRDVEILDVWIDSICWRDTATGREYISFVDEEVLPDVITRDYLCLFPTVDVTPKTHINCQEEAR